MQTVYRSVTVLMDEPDIKNEKVFVSGVDATIPTVKLGDLGLGCYIFELAKMRSDTTQYAQRALMITPCSRLQCAPPMCGLEGAAITALTCGHSL